MSLASDLSDRLARDAEAVCRHYLSAGRRYGNYWIVGDTDSTGDFQADDFYHTETLELVLMPTDFKFAGTDWTFVAATGYTLVPFILNDRAVPGLAASAVKGDLTPTILHGRSARRPSPGQTYHL